MTLKSKYRKLLLTIIANYKELPATKNDIEILIKAYPILESEKRVRETYEHLQKLNLVRKIALFKTERHNKDTIEIKQKGIDVLKENGIDVLENKKVVYEKNAEIKTKQLQYKIAEADLFFKGVLQSPRYLSLYKNSESLIYYSRDTLINFLKEKGTWEGASEYKGTRLSGVLKKGIEIYSVYNIKDKNIQIYFSRENYFTQHMCDNLNANYKGNKILLADSIDIIDNTILLDENAGKILEKRFEKEDKKRRIKSGLIFSTGTKLEKLYLLMNKVEQQELIEFFGYEDQEIRNYLIERNLDKIFEGKNFLGSFGKNAIYETNSEVGFCIVKQELNEINRIYKTLLSLENKSEKDARKKVIYGLNCNKELYDKLFAGIPYVEFEEINKEKLLSYLQGT